MTPAMCQVKHDPPNTYGDCLRACIASIMDVPCESVPHFAHDGCPGDEALKRVREWLAVQGYTLVGFAIDGIQPIADVMEWMGEQNPNATWLLFGAVATGEDHVVVCQGGRMTHNPAWIPGSIKRAGSSGHWQLMVVARL